MMALFTQYRLLAMALAAAVLMGLAATGAAQVQAWRYGGQLAELSGKHAKQLQAIATASTDTLKARSKARALLDIQRGLLDSQHYTELKHAQDTTDRLTADLAAAAKRLSVRLASPPASGAGLSAATHAAGVDDGGGARADLHPATATGLVAITGDADKCRVKLTGLQAHQRLIGAP